VFVRAGSDKEADVSKAARSVLVFGVYMVVLGVTLIAAPNLLLGISRLPATSEVWIRVVGLLVLCLAFYYIQAARRELVDFFRWTAYVRCFVFLCLGAFAALALAGPSLALFGAVDLGGAVWTMAALRSTAAT
jgi:hypothetical protein